MPRTPVSVAYTDRNVVVVCHDGTVRVSRYEWVHAQAAQHPVGWAMATPIPGSLADVAKGGE